MRTDENLNKIIVERLKSLKNTGKYSQNDIAKVLGITRGSYGFYEQGRRQINLESLIKLADFYKVSTDYILGITDEMYPSAGSLSSDEINMIKKYRMLDGSVQDAICGFIDASYAAVIEKEKENRA